MSRNYSQEQYITELQKIREQINEQKKGTPIEQLITKLKICHDKKIKSFANIIENIFNTTTKNYSISTNLTNKINNLEPISNSNNDLISNDITIINNLINELKQMINGKTDYSKVGLSKSYLDILNTIKDKATKMECPPKKSNIENVIEYFYKWRKLQIKKWKASGQKGRFKMIEMIFPVYIIVKKILHTNLYQETQQDRKAEFSFRLSDLLLNRRDFKDINEKFTSFIVLYLTNILKKYENYTLKALPGNLAFNNTKKFIIFIENFQIILQFLHDVNKKDFNNHLNNGNDEIKKFKRDFYDMILNRGTDGLGRYYSFGTKYRGVTPFRSFYNSILKKRLFPNIPKLSVPTLDSEYRNPSNNRQKRINNTLSTKKDEFSEEQKKRAMGVTRNLPTIVKTDMSELKKKAERWEKNKKNNKPSWNSSGNNGFKSGQFYNDGTRMDQGRTYGGNKTKKKKRKKRNTTRNKKRHQKKKHTKRYKKKHNKKRNNKKKYTIKNK